ncbi:ISKra4 family transposase, partial [Leptothoe sp. PORK10 BA2]|nr:ISKra4 family transposase [Leptothoe sp. PORK10 BA2]
PLAATLTCLGDGHDGIWNIIAEIGHEDQRREILDWYHLMENLAKVESSPERLDSIKDLLWEGKVKTVLAQFEDCSDAHAQAFVAYLRKHQHRIVNYEYYQLEGISIGSGAIESGIKQIAARVKLTGAQWEAKNIPQVLRHRCAYLNGQFSTVSSLS